MEVLAGIVAAIFGGVSAYTLRPPPPAVQGEPPDGEIDITRRAIYEYREFVSKGSINSGIYKQQGFLNNPATWTQQNRFRPGNPGEQIDVQEMMKREARSNAVQTYADLAFAFRNKNRALQTVKVEAVPLPQVIGWAGIDNPRNEVFMQYPLLSVKQSTGKRGNDWLRPQRDYIGSINGVSSADTVTQIWTRPDETINEFRNPFNPAGEVFTKELSNSMEMRKPRPFTVF